MSPVRIVVDNRVRFDVTGLPQAVLDELYAAFNHRNPQREKLRRMGLPHWREPATIKTWTRTRRGLSFPRGGLSRIRTILTRHRIDFFVKDHRTSGCGSRKIPDHHLELYPYQAEAVEVLAQRQNCILRAPTGGGKTSLALNLIAKLKLPALIVVWSGPLFQQWQERIERELGIPAKDIGIVRAGKMKLAPVTIAMQQTISARKAPQQLRDYFGIVILDEVHRAAAATCYSAIDPLPAKYRIGISADERRKDQKEFIVHDLFGDVASDIKREDLIQSGHVLDVEVRVVPTGFQAPWYGFEKTGDAREDIDFNRLLGEMSADTVRNALAVEHTLEEVKTGEQVLVMSHRREHCTKLAQMFASRGVRVGLLIGGEDYSKEFARTRAGLLSGELKIGVGTYQAIGTGIDLPRVGVAVCTTPIAGNKYFFSQVRGRVCRVAKGKSAARMIYLWDAAVSPGHLQNLTSWNDKVVVQDAKGWYDARSWRPDEVTISEEVVEDRTSTLKATSDPQKDREPKSGGTDAEEERSQDSGERLIGNEDDSTPSDLPRVQR